MFACWLKIDYKSPISAILCGIYTVCVCVHTSGDFILNEALINDVLMKKKELHISFSFIPYNGALKNQSFEGKIASRAEIIK